MIGVDLGILRLRGTYKEMDIHSTPISAKDNLRLCELEKDGTGSGEI